MSRPILRALAALGAVATMAAGVSCASAPDADVYTAVIAPDYNVYKESVDPYLVRRCGTLDCHGQQGRGYRIFGAFGLRYVPSFDGLPPPIEDVLEAGAFPGGRDTTETEKRANYEALIALEPEQMSRVMAQNGERPERLLLLRKPSLLERHKGGQVMGQPLSGEVGYTCVAEWLRTPPGGTLSEVGQQKCREAQSLP